MSLKLYFIALPVFFIIDMIWLGLVAQQFYASQIGFLMKTEINWVAALIFYFLFIAGLVIFVIQPGIKKSLKSTLMMGALFGLITYATYDLTNLATIRDWPLLVTVVDLIWGSVLAASISSITYILAKRLRVG